ISDPAKITSTWFSPVHRLSPSSQRMASENRLKYAVICYFLDMHINMPKVWVLDEQSHMAGIAIYF
ncbi:MAG: hypothetical protein ACREAS_05710, partial [Nitrososphaera sp.]